MSQTLVIVESPAKAKTIKNYLGSGYTVLASYGHVRDLIPKTGAVDPENDFHMRYEPIEKAKKAVAAITKALKKADALFLATDPDREGEAIAWHLVEHLKETKQLKDKTIKRVVFHQITKQAVIDAVANPRTINNALVDAQQARRALDYLVGFHLSPLLWKKIRRGLSAGRVQSPALRLIVEREAEIQAFVKKEYWSIEAALQYDKIDFNAKLISYQADKLSQFSYTSEKEVTPLVKALKDSAQGKMTVTEVNKKPRKRNPSAPFITSTLQQEAARKLGFRPANTMRIAQQLYEGMQIGEEETGLITYMRTDSVHLAQEAIDSIRDFIKKNFTDKELPSTPPVYKTKSKNAQEAHEGIRPTDIQRTPDSLQSVLSAEQLKLYTLVWQRTLASQMTPAQLSVTTILLDCGEKAVFKATGTTVLYPGFMTIYLEGKDDAKEEDNKSAKLPNVNAGDTPNVSDITGEQHFTEPPPRFSEASLIKTLEEYGIGRPSTYAAILATLKQREYVTLEKKRFEPTDLGNIVSRFLTKYFTQYVDYTFTAQLEDQLDAVARDEQAWIPVLRKFWGPFDSTIHTVEATVKRSDVTQEALDEACPECSKPLSIRLGKKGRFIGCTDYPECRYTRNLEGSEPEEEPEILEEKCPDCEHPLLIKAGRYGKFIGCSNYPKCRHMRPLHKPRDTEIECPACKDATLLERKSKRGKIFFSCAHYPKCKYATWNEPLAQACPECKWPILVEKTTKRNGTQHLCPEEKCTYSKTTVPPEK